MDDDKQQLSASGFATTKEAGASLNISKAFVHKLINENKILTGTSRKHYERT